ncbi:MAG: GNAT family N-acetyltransferase [Microcystaceae cyanobacterium]
MSSLIRLSSSETQLASNVIARALYNYPLFRSLMPDPQQRKNRLPLLTGYLVRAGMLYGEAYTTSAKMEGVAVWLAPNTDISVLELLFRVGLIACPLTLGLKVFQGAWNYVQHIEKLSQRHLSGSSWYLQVIGVTPAYQKQGYGRSLIEPMLARFREQKIPCCLDTEEENNVAYYERYGFEVVEASTIAGTNNVCWFMVKEP